MTDRSGATLTSAARAREEHLLTLHFADGPVAASTDGGGARAPVERKPRRAYMPPQPGLFDDGKE